MTDDPTALTETLAEAITLHRYLHRNAGNRSGCHGCTWVTDLPSGPKSRRAHDRHVAAALVPVVVAHTQAARADELRKVAADARAQGRVEVASFLMGYELPHARADTHHDTEDT